jgi:hypothetical protein
VPGRHVTDRQVRLHMDMRRTTPQAVAAARAGMSVVRCFGMAGVLT